MDQRCDQLAQRDLYERQQAGLRGPDGNVTASLTSTDSGSTWTTQLPYRGMRLRTYKQGCAASDSQTPTSTPRTRSMTPSQTPTPSNTGFPVQPVLDSTGELSVAAIDAVSAPLTLSESNYHAFSFNLPEADVNCGPGSYRLYELWLPLSQNATLAAQGCRLRYCAALQYATRFCSAEYRPAFSVQGGFVSSIRCLLQFPVSFHVDDECRFPA